MSNKLRVMYLQYTNPAAYPPLQHSSRMLAEEGWEVLFLGIGGHGTDALEFPSHTRISVKRLPYSPPGWRQKAHYVRFAFWVLLWTLRWRPRLIYASDPLSCPTALVLSFLPRLRTLYHEHDSPNESNVPGSKFQEFLLWTRRKLAHRAELCVLPNEQRVERFKQETGSTRRVICVWNCPALEELVKTRRAETRDHFVVFFHGSIVPARLPITVVEALAKLPKKVVFRFAGYETIGHVGYLQALRNHAKKLGISDRFLFLGTLPHRWQLLEQCRDADLGLAFMPLRPTDVNQLAMTGASNKPFDYLACGLALLVSDLPDWRRMFVEAGYGLACNPDDSDSIARALQWFVEHLTDTRVMGSRGREKIATDWNYERQFAPVLALTAEQCEFGYE